MKDAPAVVPEMEARHLAACQVERIATHVLGHLLAWYDQPAGNKAADQAVETAYYAARKLAERFK